MRVITVISLFFSFIIVVSLAKKVHINIDEGSVVKGTILALSNVTLDLGGEWALTNSNGSIKTQGYVPGQVHTDLFIAKIIEDPYIGYNDYNLMWVLWDSWTYTRQFSLNSSFISHTSIILEADGIDTISTISINGVVIGSTDNMFRKYEFNLGGIVKEGTNTITVAFSSAAAYAIQKAASYPYQFPEVENLGQGNVTSRNMIRKEQCSFAWDWGPCFAPQGIWRDIRIVAFSDAFLDEVTPQVFTIDYPKTFVVKVDAYVTASTSLTTTVSAVVGDNVAQSSSPSLSLVPGANFVSFNVTVSNPLLWYPVGYGQANLYSITISLIVGGNTISEITKRIGFRDFQIIEDPLPTGLSFYFKVNGIPIFAKGANWIPIDSFESRSSVDTVYNLLKSTVTANMNIVRVWGGGIYQHSYFYDLADEMGLMVWQEFMFACATYPRDPDFLNTVTLEVQYQIRRLAHHASIILWSGNNENEVALSPPGGGWWPVANANPYLYVADYAELYLNTVYNALKTADTSRPFVPSSPSNGLLSNDPPIGRYGNPNSEDYGDVHYYNYDDDCTNITFFPRPRFASEFGFQSHPSVYSYLEVANETELGWNSTFINHRQHHPGGNEVLLAMMLRYFKQPNLDNFGDFVYLSQVVQAMCIKAEAEHYRRLKGAPYYTMGSIYWQLNDIWQAPTWSGTDYGGRWKLLHYYAKNFYAPLLVSAYEDPVDSLVVYATSDQTEPITSGYFIAQLFNYSGIKVHQWDQKFTLPALGSASIFQSSINSLISTAGCPSRTECFLVFYLLGQNNNTIASNFFYLSTLATANLLKPNIIFDGFAQVSPFVVTFYVTADQVAPYTFLETSLAGNFNDNDILPYYS